MVSNKMEAIFSVPLSQNGFFFLSDVDLSVHTF
jgi:hypothetical protein